jgi:hypothetical protein
MPLSSVVAYNNCTFGERKHKGLCLTCPGTYQLNAVVRDGERLYLLGKSVFTECVDVVDHERGVRALRLSLSERCCLDVPPELEEEQNTTTSDDEPRPRGGAATKGKKVPQVAAPPMPKKKAPPTMFLVIFVLCISVNNIVKVVSCRYLREITTVSNYATHILFS